MSGVQGRKRRETYGGQAESISGLALTLIDSIAEQAQEATSHKKKIDELKRKIVQQRSRVQALQKYAAENVGSDVLIKFAEVLKAAEAFIERHGHEKMSMGKLVRSSSVKVELEKLHAKMDPVIENLTHYARLAVVPDLSKGSPKSVRSDDDAASSSAQAVAAAAPVLPSPPPPPPEPAAEQALPPPPVVVPTRPAPPPKSSPAAPAKPAKPLPTPSPPAKPAKPLPSPTAPAEKPLPPPPPPPSASASAAPPPPPPAAAPTGRKSGVDLGKDTTTRMAARMFEDMAQRSAK